MGGSLWSSLAGMLDLMRYVLALFEVRDVRCCSVDIQIGSDELFLLPLRCSLDRGVSRRI